MERVIFHLPWSSVEGFYWFQQELDQTVFVMSGSWADVTSRELAVFPPSAQCVCVCSWERENSVQLFPQFRCLKGFLVSRCRMWFLKWLGGKIQAINFFCDSKSILDLTGYTRCVPHHPLSSQFWVMAWGIHCQLPPLFGWWLIIMYLVEVLIWQISSEDKV